MNEPGFAYLDEHPTYRLVSSAYIDEPAIAPLYDDEAEKAVLDRLEAKTSSRLQAQQGLLDGIEAHELKDEAFGYGWSFVNAAFTYTRAGGSRFNPEGRGAWYAALRVETALAEIAFHLSRELENTGIWQNQTQYVELVARIAGPMASLSDLPEHPALDPDAGTGYPAGQAFAADMLQRDLLCIRYPSVRDPDGTCIAALRPAAVRSVARGGAHLLTWDGDPEPVIEGV